MDKVDVNLLYLDEGQNEAFDQEYHCDEELQKKFAYLRQKFPEGPRSILDVGGGNGVFMDQFLAEFRNSQGTIVDVSKSLLDRNKPNPRKRLILGSVADIQDYVGEEKFDVVTINWVLHHLVAPSYTGSIENIRNTLIVLKNILTPEGVLLIAENEFNGFLNSNIPSHIIYAVTRVQNPTFIPLIRRFFNTAGVGVCFQSRQAWMRIFRSSGLTVSHYFGYDRWRHGLKRRLAFAGLFLSDEIHGHFALIRAA